MAKYDPNKVCPNCSGYVVGFINEREQEVRDYLETQAKKLKPMQTVYDALHRDDAASKEAYKHVDALLKGQPYQYQHSTEKTNGKADDEESTRVDDLEFRLALRELKESWAERGVKLSEEDVKKLNRKSVV